MKKMILGVLAVLAMVALSSPAKADTFTFNSDVLFTGTVDETTVTLTVQCIDLAACQDWYLGTVTLKGFTFTGDPTNISEPSGYDVTNGGQDNGTNDCNDTQLGQAICWQTTLPLSSFGSQPNNTFTFIAGISNGAPETLHVQAIATCDDQKTTTGGCKVMSVSQDLNGTTEVPEPGSLMLFGTGLLSMAGFLRRKLFA
jgi:PEP-CTERM motif